MANSVEHKKNYNGIPVITTLAGGAVGTYTALRKTPEHVKIESLEAFKPKETIQLLKDSINLENAKKALTDKKITQDTFDSLKKSCDSLGEGIKNIDANATILDKIKEFSKICKENLKMFSKKSVGKFKDLDIIDNNLINKFCKDFIDNLKSSGNIIKPYLGKTAAIGAGVGLVAGLILKNISKNRQD